jgi:hypothetical protein
MNPEEINKIRELQKKYNLPKGNLRVFDGESSQEESNEETLRDIRINEMRQKMQGGKGFFREGLEDITQIGSDIKQSVGERSEKFGAIKSDLKSGEQGLFRSVFQSIGNTAGGISDAIGSVFTGGVKALMPQSLEDKTKEVLTSGVEKVMETDTAQKLVSWYSNLDEQKKRDLDAVVGIGSLGLDVAGVGVGSKVAGKAVDVAGDVAKGTLKATKGAIETGKNVAEGTVGVIQSTAQKARKVPKNIATNVAETRRIEADIKTLPKLAQESVRQGVDITDAKDILKITPKAKPAVQKLWNATKSFIDGKSELNPITAVGKPVVARLNKLKGQTDLLNEKLTQVAQGLKGRTVRGKDELVSVVNNSLETLGIRPKKTGLNFVGSDLEGIGGNTLIENVYKRLISSKDAYDLHRLKKFIDSNVEFGKRAEGLTGLSERLLKTWRKNIDGLLDNNFKSYNSVNTKLAEKISPLNDLRKYLRTAEDVLDEDLLDLDVGMLMQRIASNLRSNPALRQTLRNLDKASGVKGTLSGEIDTLVNFYSKLQDYFPEIVNKQSFRGQVTRGIQDAKGISEAVVGAVKDLAGQTDVVKKKAFRDLLDKLLN